MVPLVNSSECCVVFVDPRKTNLDSLGIQSKQRLTLRLGLLNDAAAAANVPCHFIVPGTHDDPDQWLIVPKAADQQRVHRITTGAGPLWITSGLANALTAQKRPNLLVCGFWLETTISFLALCALAAGFDVAVITDAAPANTESGCEPSLARLWQAGVVPTTTYQLFAEWAEQTCDPTLKSTLSNISQ